MSRIHSLALLGIIFSSAWLGHVAPVVEGKLTRRRRPISLDFIPIEDNIRSDTLSIIEVLLADETEDQRVGKWTASKNREITTSKKAQSHSQLIQTPRELGVGAQPSSKSSKKTRQTGKAGSKMSSKSSKSTTRRTGKAGSKMSTKSSKKNRYSASAAAQMSTKSSKKNSTKGKGKGKGAVEKLNEKYRKNQVEEIENASALAQMVLTMSMSMPPADTPSSQVKTMDGLIGLNNSPSPIASDELRPSISLSKPPSNLQVVDDLNPTVAPSTIPPIKATVDSVEGTPSQQGSSASFLTLSQFVAVAIIVVSIMAISFD